MDPRAGLRKISPSAGFDPRTIQPLASHYTNYITWIVNSKIRIIWKEAVLEFFLIFNIHGSMHRNNILVYNSN